jgi:hypothetical protein
MKLLTIISITASSSVIQQLNPSFLDQLIENEWMRKILTNSLISFGDIINAKNEWGIIDSDIYNIDKLESAINLK